MGIVYLINIERTDLYKIGTTKKPIKDRIKSLQTGNPINLVLMEYFESQQYKKIEKIIHRLLKPKKYIPDDFEDLKGEWFKLTFQDIFEFKILCKKIEDSIDFLAENSTLNFNYF